MGNTITTVGKWFNTKQITVLKILLILLANFEKQSKMAEDLQISGDTREEIYKSLFPQLQALFVSETDMIANMANFCAAIKEAFNFLWVGFYLVNDKQLVLGPFQGPVACTRIDFGRGVCGNSWKSEEAIIVDDVDSYPGHIACSSASRSEIVIPLLFDGSVWAVLDIDSEILTDFTDTDLNWLKKMLVFIKPVKFSLH